MIDGTQFTSPAAGTTLVTFPNDGDYLLYFHDFSTANSISVDFGNESFRTTLGYLYNSPFSTAYDSTGQFTIHSIIPNSSSYRKYQTSKFDVHVSDGYIQMHANVFPPSGAATDIISFDVVTTTNSTKVLKVKE